MKQVLFLLFALVLNGSASAAEGNTLPKVEPRKDWDFSELSKLPVQSGGRIKPFHAFAQELSLFLVEKKSLRGWKAEDLVLSWISDREYWNAYPLLRIRTKEVRRQLLLPEDRSDFTPNELLSSSVVTQYLHSHASSTPQTASGSTLKFDPKEAESKKVLDRLYLYLNLISGRAFPVVPKPNPEPWTGLDSLREIDPGDPIRTAFVEMLKSYMDRDHEGFKKHSRAARLAVESQIEDWEGYRSRSLNTEMAYYQYHPFVWAWILYLVAFVLFLFGKNFAMVPMWFGIAAHMIGFAMRVYVAGRPPVSNMYESIVWVSFGILIFGLIILKLHGQKIVLTVATLLGALSLIVADASPAVMDPGIQTLVPVLRSNSWLTIHVLTITASYAAFALTLGLSNIALFHFFRRQTGFMKKIDSLNQLSYRAMQIGVVLVAAGTILGGVWADYSWGRFWGWDPKEVWALIVLLAYVAILHGRFAGWVGPFGFAAASVGCFLTVLMAWYGVNFVLGAGLHSYGFTASSGLPYVTAYALLQLTYILIVWIKVRSTKGVIKN